LSAFQWAYGARFPLCKLTQACITHQHRPPQPTSTDSTSPPKLSRQFLRNTRREGMRIFPDMDDFLFLADSYDAAMLLRQRTDALCTAFGLPSNTKTSHSSRQPPQTNCRPRQGGCLASLAKTKRLARLISAFSRRVASVKRGLPAWQVASRLRHKSPIQVPCYRIRTMFPAGAAQRPSDSLRLGGGASA
jgi:hypothetical protein